MIAHISRFSRSYLLQFAGLKFEIWAGILVNFIESIFLGIFYFLPIYFTQDLKFSLLDAGVTISFFGLGTIVGGFLGGKLSDIFTSHKVCWQSLFLQSLVFLILITLRSKIALTIDVFFMGLFSYSFITSNHLWVLSRSANNEKTKLKALNILNVASNLGLAISGIAMSYVIYFGFINLFLFGSVILFILAALFWGLEKADENDQKMIKEVEQQEDICNIQPKIKAIFLVILFTSLLMGFVIFQTNTTYSQYLQDSFPELGIKALSMLFTINCLMVVFLQTHLTNIFSDYNKLKVMAIGALLIGGGTAILNIAFTFSIAILSCVVYTFGEMFFCAYSQLLCYQISPLNKKGIALGTYRMVYAGSRVIAPIIGTLIFQYINALALWYFCGILGVICFFLCFAYSKFLMETVRS